jgi:hypothetical protein
MIIIINNRCGYVLGCVVERNKGEWRFQSGKRTKQKEPKKNVVL